MASQLKIVAGNTAPNWLITCEREGSPIDLSGCSVTVNISNGSTVTRTAGSCTVTSAANGIVSYTPTATDCPEADTYVVDVTITYSDFTYETLYEQLKVRTRDPIIPVV